ncbi:hypothetical protein SAMN06295997_105109, partial [Malaciobacter marinus]
MNNHIEIFINNKSNQIPSSDLVTLNRTYKSSMLKLVKVERRDEKKSLHKR